jgi:hypothetical protein
MTESERETHEKLTASTMPIVLLVDDFHDEYGSDMTQGLIAGLIKHVAIRDAQREVMQ